MTTSYHFQLGDFACIALSDNTRTSTIQQEIADVPPDELSAGFQAIAAPGHRTDHIALLISSARQQLLHVADAVRHPIQVAQPAWNGFIDSFPAQAAETRLRLLQQAAAGQLLVFTTHITFPSLGYIREGTSGYSWQAI